MKFHTFVSRRQRPTYTKNLKIRLFLVNDVTSNHFVHNNGDCGEALTLTYIHLQ